MTRIRADLATGLGIGVAVLMLPAAALAQSEHRLSADVSATAGYQNNPFTELGGDTGTGVVTIDVAPRYQRLTERSTLTLSADANFQQYLRRYGGNQSYSGAVDFQGRPIERLTDHVRLDLSSAVLGAYGGYVPPVSVPGLGIGGVTTGGVTTGGVPEAAIVSPILTPTPLVPIADIGLFGLRNRRRSARLSADAGLGLGRGTLTVSGYGEVTRYKNLQAGDYEAYGASAGYSRPVSERLTLGVTGSASSNQYRVSIASTRFYSIQATASGRLNARWSASGALGVSFVDGNNALSTTATSLSGNASVCRRGQLTTMCLQAAREVQPTGFAGSQYVTTAGLSWSRALSEHGTATLNATYSDIGNPTGQVLVPGGLALQTQYAQANAGYSRQLRERLRLVASLDYRQFVGTGANRPKDFGGQLGLSYSIGNQR